MAVFESSFCYANFVSLARTGEDLESLVSVPEWTSGTSQGLQDSPGSPAYLEEPAAGSLPHLVRLVDHQHYFPRLGSLNTDRSTHRTAETLKSFLMLGRDLETEAAFSVKGEL